MKPACIINVHERTQYLTAAIKLFKMQEAQIVIAYSGAPGDDMYRILRDNVENDSTLMYVRAPKGTVDKSIHITWNRALKILLPQGYDPIYLGDEGMVPSLHCLARLNRVFAIDPKIGLLGPIHQAGVPQQNVPQEDEENFKECSFDELAIRDSVIQFQEAADKAERNFHTVMAVESHLRGFRAAVFSKLGLLDEGYQVGWQGDTETCLQVRQAGWDVAVCHKAYIYHYRDLFHSLTEKNGWIRHDTSYASKKGWGNGARLLQELQKDFVERSG